MRIFIVFSFLLFCFSLQGQDVIQLTDLREGPPSGVSDEGIIFESIGSSILWANDEGEGMIYFTNGLTYETKQLFEGEATKRVYNYTLLDDVIYFAVVDYDTRDNSLVGIREDGELFYVVRDVEGVADLVAHDGLLYFRLEDPIFDNTISTYDPQSGSITDLFEIENFGSEDAVVFQDEVYYLLFLSSGLNLVKLDGSSQGYEIIQNFHNGSEFTSDQNMIATEDYIYFFTTDRVHNYSLYVSDGTSSGTKRLSTDFEEINFLLYRDERAFAVLDNRMYFSGQREGNQFDSLYVADGATDVVSLIDIVPGEAPDTRFFTHFNNELYFKANEVTFFNSAIYKIDATGFGAERVLSSDISPHGYHLTTHEDALFFASFSDNGQELWTSDGSMDSTREVKDLRKGDKSSEPHQLQSAGNNLFFFAFTDSVGRELFVYNKDFVSNTYDYNSEFNVSIYPNPVKDKLSIITTGDLDVQKITIHSLGGKLIQSQNFESNSNQLQLDISHYRPGAYILSDKEGQWSKIFVKGL